MKFDQLAHLGERKPLLHEPTTMHDRAVLIGAGAKTKRLYSLEDYAWQRVGFAVIDPLFELDKSRPEAVPVSDFDNERNAIWIQRLNVIGDKGHRLKLQNPRRPPEQVA